MEKEKLLLVLGTISVLLVPGACGVAFIGFGSFVNDIEIHDPEATPPIVTLAEFERVETSMSYQKVVDIIGDPGIPITPSTGVEAADGDGETSSYLWRNGDASNMKATFRNDELLTKSQLFLE